MLSDWLEYNGELRRYEVLDGFWGNCVARIDLATFEPHVYVRSEWVSYPEGQSPSERTPESSKSWCECMLYFAGYKLAHNAKITQFADAEILRRTESDKKRGWLEDQLARTLDAARTADQLARAYPGLHYVIDWHSFNTGERGEIHALSARAAVDTMLTVIDSHAVSHNTKYNIECKLDFIKRMLIDDAISQICNNAKMSRDFDIYNKVNTILEVSNSTGIDLVSKYLVRHCHDAGCSDCVRGFHLKDDTISSQYRLSDADISSIKSQLAPYCDTAPNTHTGPLQLPEMSKMLQDAVAFRGMCTTAEYKVWHALQTNRMLRESWHIDNIYQLQAAGVALADIELVRTTAISTKLKDSPA